MMPTIQLTRAAGWDEGEVHQLILALHPLWVDQRHASGGGIEYVYAFAVDAAGTVLTITLPDEATAVDQQGIESAIRTQYPEVQRLNDPQEIIAARQAFRTMPAWGSMTAAEAMATVNALCYGLPEAEIEASINNTVTNITTAKTVLMDLAGEVVKLREMVSKLAAAVVYLRKVSVD